MIKRRKGKGFSGRLVVLAAFSLLLVPLSVQAEENAAGDTVVLNTAVQTSAVVQEPEADAQESAADMDAQEPVTADTQESLPEDVSAADAQEDLSCLTAEELALYEQMCSICSACQEQAAALQTQIEALQIQAQPLDEASTQLYGQLVQMYDGYVTQLPLMQQQQEALLAAARQRQEEAQREYGPAVIFVGDSRTVQMRNAVGENPYVWICKSSQGYNWFEEEAVPQIDEQAGYGTKILLNLGVNDVGNVNSYASLVNRKAQEWTQKGAVVYYASVNPVENGQFVTKKMVNSFNEKLKARLDPGIRWIDSYSWMMNTGYTLTDGLHFGNSTSRSLYQYYLSVLQVEN